MRRRPANPRLTRQEKLALISIAERRLLPYPIRTTRAKSRQMLTRLAGMGLLHRRLDGSAYGELTRLGRSLVKGFKMSRALPRAVFYASTANPKIGRSHIARKLGYDHFGLLRFLDEFDPEMRP